MLFYLDLVETMSAVPKYLPLPLGPKYTNFATVTPAQKRAFESTMTANAPAFVPSAAPAKPTRRSNRRGRRASTRRRAATRRSNRR